MGELEISSSMVIEYFIQILYISLICLEYILDLREESIFLINAILTNQLTSLFQSIIKSIIMKSFGEISNMQVQVFRRNGGRVINNRTQPSLLANDSSIINKNQGKCPGETEKLYVKEFFDHFFEKKSMLEVMTQVGNSIHVLQTLVTTFQNDRGIISDSKLHFKTKPINNGSFPNVIEKEGNQISQSVEDLYHRLQVIFQTFGNVQTQRKLSSPKSIKNSDENGDEELYQMLNDYKNENKKQKQLRKKSENECNQLKRQLSRIQDQKLKLSQLYKESECQVSLLNKKRIEFTQKIDELREQLNAQVLEKQQLSEKLSILYQINQNLSSIERQNQQLKTQLNKSKQNEALLAKKFDNLSDIVSKKIKEKDDKWIALIEQRLTSKTLLENATYNAFRQFMTSTQALNKC